ncbi:MAG TPA: AMP-binding protein [Mycobacteriales bacterium]|nr:AMP-binding protein [Mycobacteriales bacterium]
MPSSSATSTAWPADIPRSLDYPTVAVPSILRAAARRYGERTAFVQGGRSLTFAEVLADACRTANALAARGITPGDVVAVHLPNCLQYPAVYYGVLMAGATFSPTNPLLPPDDLAHQLADCSAAAVVTYGPVAPLLASVVDRTSVRTVLVTDAAQEADAEARVDLSALPDGWEDLLAVIAGGSADDPRVEVDPAERLAHLAYTGGTTGRSKGVELPHRNVVVNTLQFACWGTGSVPALDEHGDLTLRQLDALADDFPVRLGTGIAVNLTPWFHAMGTVGYLNLPVLTGSTTVIHQRFDPVAYVADAERYRVTTIGGAPPVFHALLQVPGLRERDLSSVRSLASGAAPLAVELIEQLAQVFPDAVIGEGYGLTEVTMGAVSNPSGRSQVRKVGSVGLPVPDTEVMVVAPDEPELRELPAGEPGEVCLRGPQVMRGYHGRPDATAEVLVDGWLRTGDVGVLDQDGYLSIVDRKKDMLLYKGYNVYPRELEEILFAHPAVSSCAVVGQPDPAAGELPVAFVVLAPGAQLTAEELMAHVGERVTPYKRVRRVEFVDSIPVSAAGKVLKRELRDRLAQQTPAPRTAEPAPAPVKG